MRIPFLAAAFALSLAGPAVAGETPSTPGARVFFLDLADGATVKSPLTLHFGIEGMKIVPAGTAEPGSGHHHLLVDAPLTPADLAYALPADEHHLHFGKGQTEATLTLTPGRHTLQLVLADQGHVPHEPPVTSPVVTITVAP